MSSESVEDNPLFRQTIVTKSDLERQFNDAVVYQERITDQMEKCHQLQFTGLFKQATEGECYQGRPLIFRRQATAEWNAWRKLGEMEETEAMRRFIQLLFKLRPNWQQEPLPAEAPVIRQSDDAFDVPVLNYEPHYVDARTCEKHSPEAKAEPLDEHQTTFSSANHIGQTGSTGLIPSPVDGQGVRAFNKITCSELSCNVMSRDDCKTNKKAKSKKSGELSKEKNVTRTKAKADPQLASTADLGKECACKPKKKVYKSPYERPPPKAAPWTMPTPCIKKTSKTSINKNTKCPVKHPSNHHPTFIQSAVPVPSTTSMSPQAKAVAADALNSLVTDEIFVPPKVRKQCPRHASCPRKESATSRCQPSFLRQHPSYLVPLQPSSPLPGPPAFDPCVLLEATLNIVPPGPKLSARAQQMNELDETGLAVLHKAARIGNRCALRKVLRVPGADINVRDRDGQTPLHHACETGQAAFVDELLQNGADRCLRDRCGQTCFDVAACREIVMMLEEEAEVYSIEGADDDDNDDDDDDDEDEKEGPEMQPPISCESGKSGKSGKSETLIGESNMCGSGGGAGRIQLSPIKMGDQQQQEKVGKECPPKAPAGCGGCGKRCGRDATV